MLIVYIRAILLYILIIFAIRLMGKRQIGELQPSELAVTILISNMATLPIEDNNIPMLIGALPIMALVGFEILISNISLKSKKFRRFISGNPVVIIREGVIDQAQMKNLRFNIDDLTEALRENGIFDIRQVQYAIVETTGSVSVLQKFSDSPATAASLNISGKDELLQIVIVNNGKIINDSLEKLNISYDWVEKTIKRNKIKTSDIFLMTSDREKNYYIVKSDKKQG